MAALVGFAGPAASGDQPPALQDPSVPVGSTSGNALAGFAGLGLDADRYRITLITGDVVTLTAGGGGRYDATVEPAVRPDGSVPSIDVDGTNDRLYAIPEDVLPFLASGRVDKELFNLTYLAANGYADAVRGLLPIIAEYPERMSDAAQEQRAQDLPASEVLHVLESIDAVALRVSKSNAEAFWASLRGEQKPAAATTDLLDAGVTKLWLDRKATIDLAESVPQIGAPQAWQAGYDGTGVKVAVLDTGIDETHPDVAGKVVASRSFVDGQTVADGHGHGTHVAATVAGTGAAQGGTYKGVAPGAQLAIGKVCNDGGSCSESSIIAGMEWATLEQRADVLNMSFGGCCTDGSDPQSQAVNRLTRDTGALFVASAGNSGPGSFTVGRPSSADAALSVAAVDKSDTLAGFSSRGPRFGDSALKPDIAAPGVGIVAARAAGTALGTPINERYTSLNGTSMAAPHVAGAAAILAQKYPDWTADQLKPALMSTAKDIGYTVYEQGAGRVDLARAVQQQLFATTANLDFKTIAFDDDAARTKNVTYSNVGDQPVTLTITSQLKTTGGVPAPDGVLVAPAAVTVPPAGTASIDVTLDPAPLAGGQYTGGIVATAPDGARLTTPVGVAIGLQLHKLTVTVRSRQKDVDAIQESMRFPFNWIRLYGVDGEGENVSTDSSESAQAGRCPAGSRLERSCSFLVPTGSYFVSADPQWLMGNRVQKAFLFDPEFTVTGDTEIVLNADDAVPIRIDTPDPTEVESQDFQYHRTTTGGASTNLFGGGSHESHVGWLSPLEAVSKGRFFLHPHWLLAAPRVTMTMRKPERRELHPFARYGGNTLPFSGERTRQLVYAGVGAPEDFARVDAAGKLVLLRSEDPKGVRLSFGQLERALAAGAAGVLFHPEQALLGLQNFGLSVAPSPPRYPSRNDYPQIPYVVLPVAEADQLIDLLGEGRVEIAVQGTPPGESPYLYSLKPYDEGSAPADPPHYSFTQRNLAVFDWHVHAWQHERAEPLLSHWRPAVDGNFTFSLKPPAFRTPRSLRVLAGPLYPDAFQAVHMLPPDFAALGEQGLYGLSVPTEQEVHWNERPFAPGAFKVPPQAFRANWGVCSGCRQGDVFHPLSVLATREGRFAGFFGAFAAPGGIHLYRDGQEVTQAAPVLGAYAAYQLPPEAARYRLTSDQTLLAAGSGVQRDIHSTWDFTSSHVTSDETPDGNPCLEALFGSTAPCRPEPLIFLRYDPDVDLDNKVRAGRSDEVRVTAYRQAATGPKIAGLKLWVSTDDGGTWDEVKVKPRGNSVFEANVKYPKLSQTTGAVSLKAEAWDVAGNRVEQTLARAFELRDERHDDHDDD